MTVKELRENLKNVSDDLIVLRDGGYDHSLLPLNWAGECTVGYFHTERHYCEWFDQESAREGETPIKAFVVGCG